MNVWRIGRGIVGAAVLAAILVVGSTVVRVWQVARADDRTASDAILVLGASQYNGRPSDVLAARLGHALTLYQQGVAPRIVTVGGNQKGDNYTEAGSGVAWLKDRGVPAAALVSVPIGNDTLQSMKAAGKVFAQHNWHSAIIVTDPWHELRSSKMAEDQGIHSVTSPTRFGPAVRTRGTEVKYVFRETVAYLYYRAFHSSADSNEHVL
ncbi:MAG TPA: YdcF family protein [Mycobacteriales bacterium]|nr:YdcF family protein [Mycobacteriales bacterium]